MRRTGHSDSCTLAKKTESLTGEDKLHFHNMKTSLRGALIQSIDIGDGRKGRFATRVPRRSLRDQGALHPAWVEGGRRPQGGRRFAAWAEGPFAPWSLRDLRAPFAPGHGILWVPKGSHEAPEWHVFIYSVYLNHFYIIVSCNIYFTVTIFP